MYQDDPTYYSGHGHWVKPADYERKARWSLRMILESEQAVQLGIACDLRDAPGYFPF